MSSARQPSRPIRIDPPRCGCTDCIIGESRPAADETEYQLESRYPKRTCCDSREMAQHEGGCPKIIGAAFGWNLGYEAGATGVGKFRNPFDPTCPTCGQRATRVTDSGTVTHNGCGGSL